MSKKKGAKGGGREIAAAYKLLVVQERMKGTPEEDVAAAFGVSKAAVTKWTALFRRHGPGALTSKRGRGGKTGLRPLKTGPVAEKVVELKRKNETWGTRRIRDVMKRFEALGVSEQQVRAILHDEGLIESPAPAKEREHGPRRFERAAPNQLWQSDIFTFRLRRAERLYVCVFMDDHSRFIVGHSLAHHQKSALVMEAFERGVATYGAPTEVLTDNGRQYTVWRGKTEFEEHLARLGVQHIRSRPQHPQTLGKVERFWKTLWDEFLGRTVFAHVVDAQRRLEHFISHYNYQRPHQALDGLVPADRFFKAAAHVRAEVERAVAQNELRLALEQPPRKPFYVVGQLGDQHLSISAGATGLEVHVAGKTETIPLQQEDTDAPSTARQFATQAQESSDAEVARDDEVGSGRGGAQSRAAGDLGAFGREARDDGDRGRRDLSRLLLPARDQGAQRDAAGTGAGRGRGFEPGRNGTAPADQAAGGEAVARGGGAAAGGADAIRAAQADRRGPGEDAPWASTDEDNVLDAGWAEKLAFVDDEEADPEVEILVLGDATECDPAELDIDWHDRGPLTWERKVAGADAPSENNDHGEGEIVDVHARTAAADGSGDSSSVRRGPGGAEPDPDGQWRSTQPGPGPQPLSDHLPSRPHGDDHGADPEAGGPSGEAGTGGCAGSGERTAAGGAGSAGGPVGDDRADDDGGGWDRLWAHAVAEGSREEEQAAGAVAVEREDRRGGEDDA
jgi:transposase InsO family protein